MALSPQEVEADLRRQGLPIRVFKVGPPADQAIIDEYCRTHMPMRITPATTENSAGELSSEPLSELQMWPVEVEPDYASKTIKQRFPDMADYNNFYLRCDGASALWYGR
jgi:hypothetical protein